ncbi:hypothetical protein [Flavihumibacter petaseus]|uniref:Uncharacterized protein n=1 Tax=Flavihumibacter petaseus NBRC 106054 TaxID=1220578 RepID=A0A0E9N4I2_9BACT|nr:hypothetical protein [Flavihumibacter petaseus]GAO44275.1 hypothetical protein FPE01S_03_03130 [Flavihumibacter petaseus NBRC 106054]
MKTLSQTWFAEGFIDFELKKYTLLAYLQEINKYFDQNMLYPQLADIIFHYNNIIKLRDNKKIMQDQFPKKLTGIQIENLQLLYEQMIADDEIMEELESIIHFAEKAIKVSIRNGTEIYETVENSIHIEPVGLVPLDNKEGYFFLASGQTKTTLVYYYRLSFFEKYDEQFRAIRTTFLTRWQRSIANSYENMKVSLIREKKELPNPAVYTINAELAFPVEETLLPIAKRCLVRYIS